MFIMGRNWLDKRDRIFSFLICFVFSTVIGNLLVMQEGLAVIVPTTVEDTKQS